MQTLQTPDGVAFLRTPEANFAGLADYPFPANYFSYEGLRLHYIDAGPKNGPLALLMHGMPTWSYLNRHIIRALTGAGWRCIAADHIGFGKSDKVTDDRWYSIARHTAAHRALIENLDLKDITLFCQDWGGPIGLGQAAQMPERFKRLVIMNTWLHHDGYEYTAALRDWNARWQSDGFFQQVIPDKISIGEFMMVSCGFLPPTVLREKIATGAPMPLSAAQAEICRGYAAPFEGLGRAGLAGPRRFPLSLPFDNPVGGAAQDQARHFAPLKSWNRPVHFIWGGTDDVFTEGWGRAWAAIYPQATFDLIPEARHFLQETHGEAIARIFLSRAA